MELGSSASETNTGGGRVDTGMSKWVLTGTREGKRLEVRGCDFYSFWDGLVTRKDALDPRVRVGESDDCGGEVERLAAFNVFLAGDLALC